jgi:hypothetical protein
LCGLGGVQKNLFSLYLEFSKIVRQNICGTKHLKENSLDGQLILDIEYVRHCNCIELDIYICIQKNW